MSIRHRHDGTDSVHDTTEDRDLIAMFNEARDPADIHRATMMARSRRRARRHDADAAATPQRRRRRTLLSGRALSFRH
jgi:hypothetical protein